MLTYGQKRQLDDVLGWECVGLEQGHPAYLKDFITDVQV